MMGQQHRSKLQLGSKMDPEVDHPQQSSNKLWVCWAELKYSSWAKEQKVEVPDEVHQGN